MSETYESLMETLNEVLAFARRNKNNAVVHQIEVPTVELAALRAGTGHSQGTL